MKITREELQAIENHISNIPPIAGMYAPVLVAWCRALLDEQDDAASDDVTRLRRLLKVAEDEAVDADDHARREATRADTAEAEAETLRAARDEARAQLAAIGAIALRDQP